MNSTTPSPKLDQSDRDQLIRRHLPLAYRLAACYRVPGKQYEDLVKTAGAGLVKAAERFDERVDVDFEAFAAPVIAAELRHSLRDDDVVAHVKTTSRDQPLRSVDESQQAISGALGRGSRVRALARRLDLDPAVLADGLVAAACRESVTLNLPVQRRGPRGADRAHGFRMRPAAA